MTTVTYGYLDLPYLVYPYGTSIVTEINNAQMTLKIAAAANIRAQQLGKIENFPGGFKAQFSAKINSSSVIRDQFNRQIASSSTVRSQQLRLITGTQPSINEQFDRKISALQTIKEQFDRKIAASSTVKGQFNRIKNAETSFFGQISRLLGGSLATKMNYGRGPVLHQICGGYLIDPYLMMPYLGPQICAHVRTQFSRMLNKTLAVKAQIQGKINTTRSIKAQYNQHIFKAVPVKGQFNRIASFRMHSQVLVALYNTTNIRILHNFPSRGTSGTNWTVVSGGTAAGSFSVNNLNTDIVEQVYRSTTTSFVIQCDTQISQGVFLDTLAILGHNFTRSATVLLQGSNDITFATVPFTETLTTAVDNIYYIAPTLPVASYRYWRLDVNDFTNTDGYLQIGTLIFGSATIFNGECFTDEVVRRKVHFADRVKTEAFSNVSNDRALKYAFGIKFQRLNFAKANYTNLSEVIDTVRTSLKALWIPTPQYPSRFAVFGKLSEMPVENHKVMGKDADYIDMDINVDESL
jgi:hypothetical protein